MKQEPDEMSARNPDNSEQADDVATLYSWRTCMEPNTGISAPRASRCEHRCASGRWPNGRGCRARKHRRRLCHGLKLPDGKICSGQVRQWCDRASSPRNSERAAAGETRGNGADAGHLAGRW